MANPHDALSWLKLVGCVVRLRDTLVLIKGFRFPTHLSTTTPLFTHSLSLATVFPSIVYQVTADSEWRSTRTEPSRLN